MTAFVTEEVVLTAVSPEYQESMLKETAVRHLCSILNSPVALPGGSQPVGLEGRH